MSDYKSCLTTLDKVIGAFSSMSIQNEYQSSVGFGIKKEKLFENMENHKQHLQYTLNSIHSSHDSYKSLIEFPHSMDLNSKYVELEKEKLSLQKDIESLQNEFKLKQENLHIIDDTDNMIDNITQEKTQKIKIKIPALKHKLNLYKTWFDVEWNNNKENNGIISGLIAINNGFKQFTFNKNEISYFDSVNKMWTMSDCEINDEINHLKTIISQQS
eukprot:UN04872